ncbi:hypothetical protein HRJ34_28510 (plasmid) [Rhizorhabdus wittichii]|uniref:Uncharacterized protein n=1 Tax=Rhizorhabdus wittichii TaxID=160791 RepID=A0A975D8P8_9SPHN|nr:hypothetical protein [Rhizorhabdus wittichii]QTH24992.1 hypothetical protein HRJ34_28510 [Rhizorhabdus wittichii]
MAAAELIGLKGGQAVALPQAEPIAHPILSPVHFRFANIYTGKGILCNMLCWRRQAYGPAAIRADEASAM